MAETITTVQQPAPIFEEGAKSYLDLLTAQTEAAGALQPLGATPTTRAAGFAPGVEAQSALAQAAQQQAATQGGLGTLSFDQTTGALSGVLNKREREYKDFGYQLDLLYHDMTAGKLDNSGEWHKHIKAVKDANSKG